MIEEIREHLEGNTKLNKVYNKVGHEWRNISELQRLYKESHKGGISFETLRFKLMQLMSAGLVERKLEGKKIYWRLKE